MSRVRAASAGDTVTIPAGLYHETLVIDRPVTLVADGEVLVDGGQRGDVVRITAPDVTLRGFTIQGSGRAVINEPAGIRVTGDRSVIEDNVVRDTLYGIVLDSSNGHVVRANRVSSVLDFPPERRGHALYLWYSTHNLVIDNVIQLAKDGIFLGFAEYTTVERNLVTHVRYGLHTMYAVDLVLRDNRFLDNVAGGSLMYSQRLTVTGNEFAGNRSPASGYGLLFKDMDDVELVGNRIHHNRLGMTIDGAPRTPGASVVLRGNLIGFNQIGLELFATSSVTFVENTFIGNLQQVESQGGNLEQRNHWSVDDRGNYWDDYQGYDAAGDSIGDLQYRYLGAFDDMVTRNPGVRAYSFTIARSAIDLAAQWFPVYQPAARVVDPAPLMSPTITVEPGRGGPDRVAAAAFALGLMVLPIGIYSGMQRGRGRGWGTC